jgi:hypothetical protein
MSDSSAPQIYTDDDVSSFVALTSSTPEAAATYLSIMNGDLGEAVNLFYNEPTLHQPAAAMAPPSSFGGGGGAGGLDALMQGVSGGGGGGFNAGSGDWNDGDDDALPIS